MEIAKATPRAIPQEATTPKVRKKMARAITRGILKNEKMAFLESTKSALHLAIKTESIRLDNVANMAVPDPSVCRYTRCTAAKTGKVHIKAAQLELSISASLGYNEVIFTGMTDRNQKPEYWGQVARKMADRQVFDEALAEQYRRIHLDLITRWADVTASQTILKTDLFAEVMCPSRAFLWDILKRNSQVTSIDISPEITSRARMNTAHYATGSSAEYITCDVRQLPFTDNSFELIISDSTLDHFRYKSDIITALSEFTRVLKPGGTLIITLDNKGNLTEPLFRLWILFRLSPFFIGKTYSIRELKKALTKTGLRVNDSTAIIHNPRLITKIIISLLRKISPARSNLWIRRLLNLLDSLEDKKIKYLTAQFIAVQAVKPVST